MSAGRPPLTVIVPTFNEESTLRDCLDSVRFADEILVVDSYSSDATVAIARELGARVLQHEYVYSAKQKNWSIPQATHEWVLLVDSDERVTPELRDEILALLVSGPRHDGYWILRANHFLGRRIRRCGWGTDKVIRLFRRDVARYQDREVHAEIDLPGPLPVLRHPLEHRSFRSFGQYWRKLQIYSEWGAAQLYKDGRRAGALQIFGRPVTRFFKMYVVRLGFLEGLHGLVLSMLGAFTVYLKYARLWEMHVLKGATGITPQVEADGLQAQEQIGRMVDEERRPRHDRAPGHTARPGQQARPR
ncbi:MAG TPA: glycosyltransferase family 2 protein [Candidatus Dormibacteraeota bacterium]|nr:glycosyltransferase family 2 protein [Candidatus Dormibacteraeota bacterium]